jgi:hypothetical protein
MLIRLEQIHSLMGEAGDHLSEASVSDLNAKVNSSRSDPGAQNLRTLIGQIPGGGGSDLSREMDDVDRMRAGPGGGGNDPSMMSPQELYVHFSLALSRFLPHLSPPGTTLFGRFFLSETRL